MRVRIIALPPGEAPEEIRRAWVGLVLPLAFGEFGLRSIAVSGVLSMPRSYFGEIWRRLTFRRKYELQYVVSVESALGILEKTAPDTAAWWRANTPHLIVPGGLFAFAADACESV